MLILDNLHFEGNSLIEICALPSMKAHCFILKNLTGDNDSNIIAMDTKGNINLLVADHELENISVINIFSFEDFISSLESLLEENNFILVIDSLTYLLDINYDYDIVKIKRVFNLLWDIIYSKETSVIILNHYQIKKENSIKTMTPRIGKLWEKIISYRILLEWENGVLIKKVINYDER